MEDVRSDGTLDPGRDPPAGVRIGELSRRVGVSPEVLRAWERRYGVLRPRRARSGQRLYTAADEARVRSMLEHMREGFSPAVAARLAGEEGGAAAPAPSAAPAAGLSRLREALTDALTRLDDAAAQAVLDRLLSDYALDTAVRDVLLPFLADLGERWARREVTVGDEHFASGVIGGRLRALARGWDAGVGPRAVLACPSDERHELGLLCFALVLRARGWRVSYLGADTPTGAIASAAARVGADVIVLSAARPEPLAQVASEVARLSAEHRLCAGGRGATPGIARRLRAERLPDDPIAAADLVSNRLTA